MINKASMIDKKTIFYRIFWIFFAGGVGGFLLETVWCYFAFGGLSSRTSNLFFPFSIVWAVGLVILSIFLYFDRSKSVLALFIKGCIFCGLFEFFCGWLGESILGVTFWDYSALPLSIGRYVNTYICLIWGILCIVWKRYVCPRWESRVIRILRKRSGVMLTVALIWFMIITNVVSGMALLRMHERSQGLAPGGLIESVLDDYFPDHVLHTYFPKMKNVNTD